MPTHTQDSIADAKPKPPALTITAKLLRCCSVLLVAVVWISAGLFGLYILAFYAASLFNGNMSKWNKVLPGMYEKGDENATIGIGVHFAMGGIILVLGSIQLINVIRERYPALHRWIGRIYVTAAALTAIGGLFFILMKGTVGGTTMDIGFGLYGLLMLLAAWKTYSHARKRETELHRAWALRLYALAIGSWLYRMDYGFWFLFTGGAGHQPDFHGTFDKLMAFFFYLPNLVVVELMLRSRSPKSSVALQVITSILLLLVITFLGMGTYYFTKKLWGPAIMDWISGR